MPSETTAPMSDRDAPIAWRTLLNRIERLRRSLAWTAALAFAATLACWPIAPRLWAIVAQPLTRALIERGEDPRLAFTRLTDPFVVYFSVCVVAGLVVAVPVLMLQLWRLLGPEHPGKRWRAAGAFVLVGSLLFVAGLVFGHQVLLPYVVRYLLGIAGELQQLITARDYLRFALRLLVIMGLSAQLPLLSLVLARAGLVTASRLWRWLPYATLVAFALAAIITPPDGVSQVIVAVPLLALYVISILVAAVAGRRASGGDVPRS